MLASDLPQAIITDWGFDASVPSQHPRHQFVAHDETWSSRDAELTGENSIYRNDSLPLTAHVEQIKQALGDALHLVGKISP
jgi:hypothetical protein